MVKYQVFVLIEHGEDLLKLYEWKYRWDTHTQIENIVYKYKVYLNIFCLVYFRLLSFIHYLKSVKKNQATLFHIVHSFLQRKFKREFDNKTLEYSNNFICADIV